MRISDWEFRRVLFRSAHDATWLNGIMAHARDYDDTHDAAVLHAGVSVVPAALAAADIAGRPVAGADLLAGLVAVLELICRLCMATGIGMIESGFIFTGRCVEHTSVLQALRRRSYGLFLILKNTRILH